MSEDQKPLATLADSLEEARPVNLDESELTVQGIGSPVAIATQGTIATAS